MKRWMNLLCVIMFTSCFANAQGVIYEWAKTYGNNGDGSFRNMAKDSAGNIYSVGSFQGSVDFDPGPGTTNISIGGSAQDAYIQKLDSNGNLLWVNAYFAPSGSVQNVIAQSVTCDDSNNVYVVGSFNGTVDFDYGPSVVSVTSTGTGIFILKLDSLGNFIWVQDLGNSGTIQTVHDVQYVDGFLYVLGAHIGTLDVNPNPPVFNLDGNGTFILKLDSNGTFNRGYQLKGSDVTNGYAQGASLTIDNLQNVYVTGYFENSVDFDPGPSTFNLSANGFRDCFAAKIDSVGELGWAVAFGGSIQDESRWISLDPSDGVYLGGSFMNTVDFDPGVGTSIVTSSGETDAFVVKIDTAGNFGWARTFGSVGQELTFSVSNDASGNVYASGFFSDTVDFDPGLIEFNLIPDTARQMFVLKLNNAGDFVFAKQFEGTLLQNAFSIYTDLTSDDIFVGGNYREFIDFDPGVNSAMVTAPSGKENFLLKLSQCTVSYGTDVVTACESLTWLDGITYTANNNTATYTLSNAAITGCDSIVSLDLTITQSSSGIDMITACDSLMWTNGITYYSSNSSATDTLLNSVGCDSVVTLNLTIANVDVSTSIQNATISAGEVGASYQWLDCNDNYSIITGATNASFTPLINGSYAVEVTKNNCTDTSVCVVVDNVSVEDQLMNLIRVFPNPASDFITIEFSEKTEFNVKVVSLSGKLVYRAEEIHDKLFTVDLNVDAGVYLLVIESGNRLFYERVLVRSKVEP
ncbi:MAG: T9SS type A sorting domain-containing protein [Crocinitomicaceae bacterium]